MCYSQRFDPTLAYVNPDAILSSITKWMYPTDTPTDLSPAQKAQVVSVLPLYQTLSIVAGPVPGYFSPGIIIMSPSANRLLKYRILRTSVIFGQAFQQGDAGGVFRGDVSSFIASDSYTYNDYQDNINDNFGMRFDDSNNARAWNVDRMSIRFCDVDNSPLPYAAIHISSKGGVAVEPPTIGYSSAFEIPRVAKYSYPINSLNDAPLVTGLGITGGLQKMASGFSNDYWISNKWSTGFYTKYDPRLIGGVTVNVVIDIPDAYIQGIKNPETDVYVGLPLGPQSTRTIDQGGSGPGGVNVDNAQYEELPFDRSTTFYSLSEIVRLNNVNFRNELSVEKQIHQSTNLDVPGTARWQSLIQTTHEIGQAGILEDVFPTDPPGNGIVQPVIS